MSLKVDYCTHSHAQGLIAIIYAVKETGGILVCCDHGVITHFGATVTIGCQLANTMLWQPRTRIFQSLQESSLKVGSVRRKQSKQPEKDFVFKLSLTMY